MSANKCNPATLTILGSGTCVPSLKRSACSVLLKIKDSLILLDAGPGTMRRLLEAGTEIFDIAYIFFSHFHPDHTGELVSFLFASKYPENLARKTALTLGGGKGFSQFYNGLGNVFGQWIELAPGLINIAEFDNQGYDSRSYDHFKVESLPVNHRDESVAYRFSGKDSPSIVYSGDTDYSENLILLAKNADILICESSHSDDFKTKGHLTPSLAGEIATRANVKKLILTHFYPDCENANIEKECRKTYNGPLVLAEDLMTVELGGLT